MPSITIAKISRASGARFKSIIRDHAGRSIKSKTFTKLGLAREWARRVVADRELVETLGTEAAGLTLSRLVEGDPPKRPPFTVSADREWQVNYWIRRLGERQLLEITADEIRLALNEWHHRRGAVSVREGVIGDVVVGSVVERLGRRLGPGDGRSLRIQAEVVKDAAGLGRLGDEGDEL